MKLAVRWFSERNQFVHQHIGSLFQKHSPSAEDSQCWDANQKKHPDRHFANAKAKPNDIGLMNEIQAIGIEPDKAKEFGWPSEERNDSGDAHDFEQATGARGEIDKNVFVQSVIEL